MESFAEYLRDSHKLTVRYQETEAEATTERLRRVIDPPFYINKLNHHIPQETQRWIRTAADERAVIENGCRFIERQGDYAVDWSETHCVLYEGEMAGDLIRLDDWQYEMYMQVFGWHWFNEEWEQRRQGAGWVRRYRVASGWVPKKNCKSPTLASVGLYLLVADGEQGQKCFSLATTYDQASIAHNHAVNFIKQSPTLGSHCKVDGSSLKITDIWSNSTYSILCGDKGTNKTSKEGINGSLLVDETHVVSGAFMEVIKRAGISRRQFLKLQLSTVGEDTAGYGFDQYTFGVNNLKAADEGRKFNFRFLHFEYAVPQDTSVKDLRDREKISDFIRLANPTLGRVTSLTEALEDYDESCRNDTALIKFAMYRLNLWNTGGGNFIAGSDWEKVKRTFSMSEVAEHPCVIGIDMSKVRDMTAAVIVWAVPTILHLPENPLEANSPLIEREINIPYVMPYFWVPHRTLQQYEEHIDIPTLAQSKQCSVTQAATVRPEIISEFINSIDKKFDLRGVASDLAYSRALSAHLHSTHGWDVEGDDTRFFLIPQTTVGIGPAIQQLYGCVLDEQIVQNGNKLMHWQLGNIQMVEDTNNNSRFSKPHINDYRKIDGWAALANAFYLMMANPDLYPGQELHISLGVR